MFLQIVLFLCLFFALLFFGIAHNNSHWISRVSFSRGTRAGIVFIADGKTIFPVYLKCDMQIVLAINIAPSKLGNAAKGKAIFPIIIIIGAADKYRPNLSLNVKSPLFTWERGERESARALATLTFCSYPFCRYKMAAVVMINPQGENRWAAIEKLEKRLNLARYIRGNLKCWLEHFATICLNKLVRVADGRVLCDKNTIYSWICMAFNRIFCCVYLLWVFLTALEQFRRRF